MIVDPRHQKLQQMQALPLAEKIHASQRRIREWLDVHPDATVSFSGGRDSTVLLHLVRSVSPGTRGVFANTGLEYPEIVEFVRATPNIIEVRPRMSFLEVVQAYGYPVISKLIAHNIDQCQRLPKDGPCYRLRKTGIKKDGTLGHSNNKIPNKWWFLVDSPIRISSKCCDKLKKEPLRAFKFPIVGTMADEGRQRKLAYIKKGCNIFDGPDAQSRPMSFWTSADVQEYLRAFKIPYCRIYDMGESRTGCIFCLFGIHMEGRPNRFDRLYCTHPQLYSYCMDGPLQLRKVLMEVFKIDAL